LLDGQQIDRVEIIVKPVKEHRLVVLFRGTGLDDGISDTDPQKTGAKPLKATADNPGAKATTSAINQFVEKAAVILSKKAPANMVLLRGFSSLPDLPLLSTMFKLKPAAVASYPMYRGLAKLAGMTVLPTGPQLEDEIQTLERNFESYDYFFLHVKGADSAGEDGDFQRKVEVIEQIDSYLPRIMALDPDVLVVTGDHSTPAILKSHSWHPVPLMVYGRYCRPDTVQAFSERDCLAGGLGNIRSNRIMPLAMANALKMLKYGA
jgi:2,3-bisphosphoglycerate-independent phosphoglycerate mutase